MTQAQVLATEANKPSGIRASDGEMIERYDSVQMWGLAARAVYIFAKDKLVRAKYLFDAEHVEENDFIVDFKTIEPLLMEKYGKSASSRAFWENDLTQQEPKSYLDQDRAAPSDILPSDRFVGLAVSLGHLTHQIEYLSAALEALENEVRSGAAERF